MLGKQILNYRIESLIGQGGMGSVYLASNINIDQKVAIKVLNTGLANNPEIRKRFEREAVMLSSLDHQNVVKFLNYFENAEGIFLIMEYVKGMTLDKYINEVTGPIPEEKALDLFSQILDAFSYAHKMGIVHRDIKPSNIILTSENKIKILDFGIARIIKESTPGMTKSGTVMGTAMYMSPEQVRGQELDKHSDIYSLGVVLHQMLAGRAPYDDTTMSEFDIYSKVVEEKLPRVKEFYPFVSDKVQSVIDKAVEKSPEHRYGDCEDFKYYLTKAIKPEEAVKLQTNPLYRWIAAGAAVILLVAGFWFWDYNRVKVRYYKDFVEQWGVPLGIHELSKKEVSHREASYRFECRRGKLQRFTRVNSAGKIREHHDSEHFEYPNDMKLFYSENGKLSYSQYLDRNGKILFKKVYNESLNVVIFKHADQYETELALSARTLQQFNNPFSASGEVGQISRYLLTYDDKGFIKKILYAKYLNIPIGDKDGIFGREYVRDEKGRVIEEHYLGFDGKPKATKKGLAIKKHTFIENDDWVETRYLDVNNNVVMDETGVPVVKLTYDEYGNRIKEEYRSGDGKLVYRTDVKAAGFLYKYDEKGNNTERTYFDTSEKICNAMDGIAGVKYVYDESGNATEWSFIDDKNKTGVTTEGFVRVKAEYDEKGNNTAQWFFNEKGELYRTKQGYAGYKAVFDAVGNMTEYVFYGVNNKPCASTGGAAGYRLSYNDLNKITMIVSLDSTLQTAYDYSNICFCYRRYDKRGNQTGESYYDKSGKMLRNNSSNYAGWNCSYDDQGNEISRSFYNADSLPCLVSGYASYTLKYDDRGNPTEIRYYDESGNLRLANNNYAGLNYKYDERGNKIETMYIGTDGNPSANYLITRYKYDKNDNCIEYSLYNNRGELSLCGSGYAGYRAVYNDRNQETQRDYFDLSGSLTRTNDGYAIVRNKYDDRGNWIEQDYFDEYGRPCVNNRGWARIVNEYNEEGKYIKQKYFDLQGNQVPWS